MIAISQSGETADTLAAIKLAKEKGVEIKDVLISAKVVSSNSDWRRLIDGKAVTYVVTNQIIEDPHIKAGESTVMRIGKKRFVKFNVKVK